MKEVGVSRFQSFQRSKIKWNLPQSDPGQPVSVNVRLSRWSQWVSAHSVQPVDNWVFAQLKKFESYSVPSGFYNAILLLVRTRTDLFIYEINQRIWILCTGDTGNRGRTHQTSQTGFCIKNLEYLSHNFPRSFSSCWIKTSVEKRRSPGPPAWPVADVPNVQPELIIMLLRLTNLTNSARKESLLPGRERQNKNGKTRFLFPNAASLSLAQPEV